MGKFAPHAPSWVLRALAHALDGDSAGDEPLRDGATHRGGAGAPRRGDGPERPSGERAEP